MKSILLALAGLVLVGFGGGGGASTTAAGPSGTCYECRMTGGGTCMDCWYPIAPGHVSCIPYCNGTCLVGAQCGQAFRVLELDGDGSILDDGLGGLALASSEVGMVGMARVVQVGDDVEHPERVALNCRGLVVARQYSESRAEKIILLTEGLRI